MERSFPAKTIALVANTTVTITWSGPDFSPRFNESIIKRPVAVRFSCSTTALNAVNCGVRYRTITKDYLVAERKTLFVIPAAGSAEITPASKPALGMLNEWITDIFLDLTAPVTGNVTVTLIIDDEPPPLTGDPGELIGLDAKLNLDYLIINQVANQLCNPATNSTLILYTVPAGKRFILDLLTGYMPPTPSYPELLQWSAYLPGPNISIYHSSKDTEGYSFIALQNSGYIFNAGDVLQVDVFNADTTAYAVRAFMIGREIF